MRWLHTLKTCRPGRRRRGAGLADMTLAMVVMVVVIDGAVRFGTDLVSRNAVALTAGQLSRLADDVEAWAAAEYTTLQPRVDALAHDTEEQSWAALIAAGDVSQDSVPATALRQSVRVFLHAPAAGNLYVVLLTETPGAGSVSHVPRPDGGAQLVGRVDAHAVTELRGWDFTYDLTLTSSRRRAMISRASSGRSGRCPTRSMCLPICTGSPCPAGPSSTGSKRRST